MKQHRLLFLSFFFSVCFLPVLAQNDNNEDGSLWRNVAPEGPYTEIPGTLKYSEDDTNKILQIISNNRGPGSNNSGNSPMAIPVNNNCADAIALTVNAACINGTNKEATVEPGENTACQGAVTKTVWYKFTATSATHFVEVERTASSGCYLSSAIYSGSCLPSTSLSCEDAALGPNLNIHNLTGLGIGSTYYIQVSYTGGSLCGNNNNAGTGANFCIKVGTPQNCNACNTPCGSLCIFPTTPTVSQVTSSCPKYDLRPRINAGQTKKQCYTFTAVGASFSLQMIINASGCSSGNVSTFDWQLYSAGNCGSVIQSGNLSNLIATGLTTGAAYILCYTWTATCQHSSVYPYMVATSPLPIHLLEFSGKKTEKAVQLNWSTGSEINNRYFSVLRSNDGMIFKEIGQVIGHGNSTSLKEYNFIDKNPESGVNYYKLIQYDYDNNSSTSKIIAIKYFNNFSVKIGSNPVKDVVLIYLETDQDNTTTFTIINNLGEPVISLPKKIIKGANRFSIPADQLTKGTYFLKTENKAGDSWIRFVKL